MFFWFVSALKLRYVIDCKTVDLGYRVHTSLYRSIVKLVGPHSAASHLLENGFDRKQELRIVYDKILCTFLSQISNASLTFSSSLRYVQSRDFVVSFKDPFTKRVVAAKFLAIGMVCQ